MTRTRRIAVSLIGLLACAVAVWLWWYGAGPQQPVTVDAHEGGRAEVDAPAGARRSEAAKAPPSSAEADQGRQGTARAPVEEDRRVRITGRCITVEGQPIRDCRISVWTYQTRAQQVKFPDRGRQKIPRVQSGENGRFEARFLPSEVRSYRLAFSKKGRAHHSGNLGSLGPAETRDLGDIVLLAGAVVRGRVLDEQGRPAAACRVTLSAGDRLSAALDKSTTAFQPRRTGWATTNETGRFVLYGPLCSGRWKVAVSRELVSPKELVIPDDQSAVDLLIRARSHDDKDLIQGHVVDEKGQPIPHADLSYRPRPTRGQVVSGYYSQKDGSFQIVRSEWDTGVPVRLRVDKDGFDPLKPAKSYHWGTSGLRLVLKRGTNLVVHVVDAETHRPIEGYAVQIRNLGSGRTRVGLQHGGRHEHGILRFPGLARGRYLITVVPREGYASSRWKEVEVAKMEGAPLVFELHRLVEQPLHVLTTRGDPVVGSRVELLEPVKGHPIDAETFVGGITRMTSRRNEGRPWTQGKTDDKGMLLLSGPPDRDLGLRIFGVDHVPLFINGIRLQKDGEPLRVQVKTGATLIGRIRPTQVLRRLKELGKGGDDVSPASSGSKAPGLKLIQDSPPNRFPPGLFTRVPIAEDGTFKITGIAPGSWTLRLLWNRAAGASLNYNWLALQQVADLRDGEERHLELDLSRFLLGEVEGSVTFNQRPAKNWTLHLRVRKPSLPQGISTLLDVSVPLDESGRFSTQLMPGLYDCSLSPENMSGPWRPPYPTGSTLRVTAGSKQKIRLNLDTAELRLRFLNHDGKPLPGLRTTLVEEASGQRLSLPVSDATGNCTTQAPIGAFRLVVLPKYLTTREGYLAFSKAHEKDYETAKEKAHIRLGTLTIQASPQPEPREITVPRSAGY